MESVKSGLRTLVDIQVILFGPSERVLNLGAARKRFLVDKASFQLKWIYVFSCWSSAGRTKFTVSLTERRREDFYL